VGGLAAGHFDRHGSLRCALLPVNNIPLPTRHAIRQFVALATLRFISDDKHLTRDASLTTAADLPAGLVGGLLPVANKAQRSEPLRPATAVRHCAL